jgi:hypothetical protein
MQIGFAENLSDNADIVSPRYYLGDAEVFALRNCAFGNSNFVLTEVSEVGMNEDSLDESRSLIRRAVGESLDLTNSSNLAMSRQAVILTKEGLLYRTLEEPSAESIFAKYAAMNISSQDVEKGSYRFYNQNQQVYLQIFRRLVSSMLASRSPAFGNGLAESVSVAMTQDSLLETLGGHMLLWQLKRDAEPLLNPLPTSETGDQAVNASRNLAFGYLIRSLFEPEQLIQAWFGSDRQDFFINLKKAGADPQIVERIRPGWTLPGSYDPEFEPDVFLDNDRDGIPNLWEVQRGFSPNLADSNSDGWSDLTELVHEVLPGSSISMPSFISVDGLFKEWLDLIPSRLYLDKDRSGTDCDQRGDIDLFSALVQQGRLIVGAQIKNATPDTSLLWNVFFEYLPRSRLIAVESLEDQQGYLIKLGSEKQLTYYTAWSYDKGAIEILVDSEQLGLGAVQLKPQDFNVRVQSYLITDGEKKFCDDTPWFRPFETF